MSVKEVFVPFTATHFAPTSPNAEAAARKIASQVPGFTKTKKIRSTTRGFVFPQDSTGDIVIKATTGAGSETKRKLRR